MKNRLINALHRLPWSGGDRAGARTGRLSQRTIFAIAAGVLVVLLALATGLFLKHQSGFVPENNVDTMDIERSQVYLTGVGYAIDKKQKDDHDEIEDQLEDIDDIEEDDLSDSNNRRFTPPTYTPRYTPRASSGNSYNRRSNRRTTASKLNPKVKTNLPKKASETVLDFWVTATDHYGTNIPETSSGKEGFTVKCNGTPLRSTGVEDKRTSFRANLEEGKNKIKITARDRYGRKTTKSYSLEYKSDKPAKTEDNGNAGKEEKPGPENNTESKPVKATLSVLTPGLELAEPILEDAEITAKDGESLEKAVTDALRKEGLEYTIEKGKLIEIRKKGIAKDAAIADDIELDPESLAESDENRLRNGDFCKTSKWMYQIGNKVKDDWEDAGELKEGDRITLLFVLSGELPESK